MLKHLIFTFIIIVSAKSEIRYDDYKVIRLDPTTEEQFEFLKQLEQSSDDYNYWKHPTRFRPTDLMVAPEKLQEFMQILNITDIQYSTYIENVQALIDNQNSLSKSDSIFDWTNYHTLEEIHNWLEQLAKIYPEFVKIIIGGRSYEGREIKGVKISFKPNNPGIFIEGGIHAREWISPATVTYLINEFLTSKNPDVRQLAEAHDWYIFPSVNPDGYVYTHTTDRLWRKTRSQNQSPCYGVDGNRNWDDEWMTVGSSKDACNENYGGNAPFSEIEFRSLSQYIKSIGNKLFAYISFHSYSHLLLHPYGHAFEKLDNYNATVAIGRKTVEALSQRYGTKYTLGSFYEALYPGSGISIDWVKSTLKLPITFLFELRDQGQYGFLLPPNQIIPNSEEILDALIAMFEEAKKYGYPNRKKIFLRVKVQNTM